MRISDWSSDVCSSDLRLLRRDWSNRFLHRRLLLRGHARGAAQRPEGAASSIQVAGHESVGGATPHRHTPIAFLSDTAHHQPGHHDVQRYGYFLGGNASRIDLSKQPAYLRKFRLRRNTGYGGASILAHQRISGSTPTRI